MKRPPKIDRLELVNAIVEDLFRNGDGREAARLVLTSREGGDLGGWNRIAVTDRIVRAIAPALDELEAIRRRASTLEDAAFHFQTCRTCRTAGEEQCTSGRHFARFLRGER